MHNMAMALHNKGFQITGSDDEIFEPSRSRLESYGLLPEKQGWDPGQITPELDGIILGMHAREDNPELLRARELGIRIWSFPEYIYEQSRDKKRVVIGGSHGKTTVTSMIMHVLWYNHYPFDYMVGSQLEGFETMVKLTKDAPVIILEGDEYLSSPIDPRPKFHLYHPHIALITGIAWDHMNVFPEFDIYLEQFREFVRHVDVNGKLFWYREDPYLKSISENCKAESLSYGTHPYSIKDGKTFLLHEGELTEVPVFGNHNMQNISAALLVCRELGLTDDQFYEAISSFRGAAKRQEILAESETRKVYLDFAHAPSKVRATVNSFRENFPGKKLIACLELHTFSSLNQAFLPQYAASLDEADVAIVFFNPEVVKHKKLPPLDPEFIKSCFGRKDLKLFNDREELKNFLLSLDLDGIYLLMSSGNFSGLELKNIASRIAG